MRVKRVPAISFLFEPRAGFIKVPGSTPINHTFYMDSDDGSLLYIDGKQLINHKGAYLYMPAECSVTNKE